MRKRTTVYIPQEMITKIEQSLGRDGTWQEWAFRAIRRQFVEEFEKGIKAVPIQTPSPEYAAWHKKLDLILKAGGEGAQKVVDAFFAYALPGKTQGPPQQERPRRRRA